jgi:hypothetical protein
MGVMGATICTDCNNPPDVKNFDLMWKCTAVAPTGNSNRLTGANEYVLYFQPTGITTNNSWANVATGACFNLAFYYLQYAYIQHSPGNVVFEMVANTPLGDCSYTCFKKMDGQDCDSYPTSVLQYANNSDAFGFYYDALIELVDNINYLNSIRLPVYLHSPAQAEDQMSYQKSDGSTLKLSHRIWTDYKLKSDYLSADQHAALVAATAHDLVFIACGYAGLNPWPLNLYGIPSAYQYTGTPTQFVRTEKIEVEWQQETMPRFKLGQAKGTLRLALAAENVNTNCG